MDVPGSGCEGDDDAKVLTSSDINILGESHHEVIGDSRGIGGDVGGNDAKSPTEGSEEHRGSVHEDGDLEGVPGADAVDDLRCGRDYDTKDGTKTDKAVM